VDAVSTESGADPGSDHSRDDSAQQRADHVVDGPIDPFRDDPDDPAGLLDPVDAEAAQPLTPEERADVLADLAELQTFRVVLAPLGVQGIAVECDDCGEQHFFGWDLMTANLRALLSESRTHVHEPAFAPDPDAFVSWDYARGYTDAVHTAAKPS
jgi:hypothetical protein